MCPRIIPTTWSSLSPLATYPRLVELVGELSMKSDLFRRLWARQDVVRPAGGLARMHHPNVGDLTLHREKLGIAGTDRQVLVIYHADPGTASADALGLLGSIAATNAPHARLKGITDADAQRC